MKRKNKAMTLLEILLFIILVSVIILAISNIDLFSRHQVISSDRRSKLQNEVSYALEQMTKRINQAIGNFNNPAVKAYNDHKGIRVRIDDRPANGRADDTDTWIAYRHEDIGSPATDSQIRFYANAGESESPAGSYEEIAHRILMTASSFDGLHFFGNFNPSSGWLHDYILNVRITACWDPANITLPRDGSAPQGTADNPCVTMNGAIYMPSVSTH